MEHLNITWAQLVEHSRSLGKNCLAIERHRVEKGRTAVRHEYHHICGHFLIVLDCDQVTLSDLVLLLHQEAHAAVRVDIDFLVVG
jgi:hypothetical protein